MAAARVRPMRAADRRFAWELNERSTPHVASETQDELARLCTISVSALVAEVDGAPAGFLLGMTADADYDSENFLWFRDRYEGFLYVDRLAVDAAFHRRGAGAAMYREAERIARAAGLGIVCCEVNLRPPNPVSLAFHGALGFTKVGEQETEKGAKTVAMLVKPLT